MVSITTPALIGLDWGSSRLRALLLGPRGEVLEERSSPQGASTLHGGSAAFVAALDALVPDWPSELPVLACGMVGSRHGWREVPYAECPADASRLARAARTVNWHGRKVQLLPGLRCESEAGTPELMRGEETQALGALQLEPALAEGACLVMPGTHSKWVALREGRVQRFVTHMSGEVYGLLRQHSVLGRLMPAQHGHESSEGSAADSAGLDAGLRAARAHGGLGLLQQLFAVRSLGLMERFDPAGLPAYLSGLIIGHELRAGLHWRERQGLAARPTRLVGEPALCRRYARAFDIFEAGDAAALAHCTAAGLALLGQQGIR